MKKNGDRAALKLSLGTFMQAKKDGQFSDYDVMKDPFMLKYTRNVVTK